MNNQKYKITFYYGNGSFFSSEVDKEDLDEILKNLKRRFDGSLFCSSRYGY